MTTARDKVVQYLQETRAAEYTLIDLLAVHIAITPKSDYRQMLESQLQRSRERGRRLSKRLEELGEHRTLRYISFGVARVVGGQAVALAAVSLQLLRGPGGEEKLLKNARDACAAAALLVADYRALEQVAHTVGDKATAKLAAELRGETEQMLSECFDALDELAEGVISAEVKGQPVYRISRIGAVQMLRLPQLRENIYRLSHEAADAVRQARRGVMRLEAETRTAAEAEPPIPDYDALPIDEIRDRLPQLSQAELATIEAYERKTRNRASILKAVDNLRGNEPWPGYDEMNVTEIRSRLREANPDKIREVLDYERRHKNRSTILNAPEAQVGVS
ncbi:hypothetical protein C3Y87_20840 [Carbonactinospora thermoautotrophica]|uniref:hypothetical protein n=1 Tax=Carbonactinospora thermoautotrophica TaxID=1469144 RepID=UPI002271E92E|nr:hypothetical protein [Carbonactinospora thermoautotrophica]MCX9193778.1 hypothetical protein [Carbonactinospora thermoautotrophica]